jgi:hypothetical protein
MMLPLHVPIAYQCLKGCRLSDNGLVLPLMPCTFVAGVHESMNQRLLIQRKVPSFLRHFQCQQCHESMGLKTPLGELRHTGMKRI